MKTKFKTSLERITICIIVALVIALISALNTKTVLYRIDKPSMSKHELNLNKSWRPWMLNKEWNAQEMPVLTSTESHQRFIELAERYNLPADVIWNTENYYWLKEWTIICIAIAETSWWKPWTYGEEWCWNYGNVGNNDRGNRRCFPNQWAWLAAIGQTLTNDNLKNNKTIACLNWAWECIEQGASWKRYSTLKSWNRQRNMIWCFHSIYQTPINPKTFNLHDR